MDYKILRKRDILVNEYQDKLQAFLTDIGRKDPLPAGNPLLKPLDFFYTQNNALFSRTPFARRSDPCASSTKCITKETFPDFLVSVCGLPDSENAQPQRSELYRALKKYVMTECVISPLMERVSRVSSLRAG